MTRRKWLYTAGAAAAALFRPRRARAGGLPTAPVAVARCSGYGNQVVEKLSDMFDQIGGIGHLVAGRTVGIKVNLVGDPWGSLGGDPRELSHWTHPDVIGATVYLLGRAGANRIRILECCGDWLDPFESYIGEAGWRPADILNAAPNVEFENTNGLGTGDAYSRLVCPAGGFIFPAYDVNHSYVDCDFFVSLAKMKEHNWFGVTLSMKNCYGMTPLTIYGDTAGGDEPATAIQGTRVSVFHRGILTPSKSAPQEIDPDSPRAGDYRIPRIVADIVSARPVDLAIIDGIESMAGGEGPWAARARRVSPRLLVAGLNPVTTDAVATALMGFDPMAGRGTPPFDDCDSFLQFAEQLGLGTRDLNEIEVVGMPVAEARFDFRAA